MLLQLCLVISFSATIFADIEEDYAQFASTVLKEVDRTVNGNYVVSPANINVLLALLRLGSDGDTEKALTKALNIKGSRIDQLSRDFQNLSPGFHLVRRLFIRQNLAVKKDYLDICREFDAQVEKINFASEDDAWEYNKAVSEASKGFLESNITAEEVRPDSSLVVISGLTFQAKWETPFPTSLISEESFTSGDRELKVRTLNNPNAKFGYLKDEENGLQLLEIPINDILQLLVLLPDDPKQVKSIPAKIPQFILKELPIKQVDVSIPSFKIDNVLDVTSIFSAMGIPATDQSADFSYIGGSEKGDIYVSKFFATSSISVDAAGIGLDDEDPESNASDGQAEVQFKANGPFYFILKNGPAAVIAGAVIDPNESNQ